MNKKKLKLLPKVLVSSLFLVVPLYICFNFVLQINVGKSIYCIAIAYIFFVFNELDLSYLENEIKELKNKES